eukprot:5619168-Prymnesium_polylepis.2
MPEVNQIQHRERRSGWKRAPAEHACGAARPTTRILCLADAVVLQLQQTTIRLDGLAADLRAIQKRTSVGRSANGGPHAIGHGFMANIGEVMPVGAEEGPRFPHPEVPHGVSHGEVQSRCLGEPHAKRPLVAVSGHVVERQHAKDGERARVLRWQVLLPQRLQRRVPAVHGPVESIPQPKIHKKTKVVHVDEDRVRIASAQLGQQQIQHHRPVDPELKQHNVHWLGWRGAAEPARLSHGVVEAVFKVALVRVGTAPPRVQQRVHAKRGRHRRARSDRQIAHGHVTHAHSLFEARGEEVWERGPRLAIAPLDARPPGHRPTERHDGRSASRLHSRHRARCEPAGSARHQLAV